MKYTIILLLLAPALLAAQTIKPATVVGFANLGARADDSIGAMIGTSLVTFLQKIPGAIVTPFADSEKAARDKGFFAASAARADLALTVAQGFDTRQAVFGDYKVTGDTITINVTVLDTVTGEARFQKTYKGGAGLDIFDTIDSMVRNVSGLIAGRELSVARVIVNTAEPRQYALSINGRFEKELGRGRNAEAVVLANEKTELSLRESSSGRVVYTETFTLSAGEIRTIDYKAMGVLTVKLPSGAGMLFINGRGAGMVDENRDFTLSLPATNAPVKITLMDGTNVRKEKTVFIREGETTLLILGEVEKRRFFFNVRPLDLRNGPGAAFGADFLPFSTLPLRAGILGGAVFAADSVVPHLSVNVAYALSLPAGFTAKAGLEGLYSFAPSSYFSLVLSGGLEWSIFTLDIGARCSFLPDADPWHPALSLGLRF